LTAGRLIRLENRITHEVLHMKYRSVVATRYGCPDVLQIMENDPHPPAANEARIKVLAAVVSRPDISVRRGDALYSGTPLGQKRPFVPGYAIIGDVDGVGEAVTLILNYLVAFQTMYRSAKVRQRGTVLIVGASGGIGTALLQLGKLTSLRMFGIASQHKHPFIAKMGLRPSITTAKTSSR